MKCEFCNKELATKKTLISHQKTIACTNIQKKLKDKNNKVEDRILEINNIKILQRGIDGYINITAISALVNKRTDSWLKTDTTIQFIDSLMKETGLSKEQLLIYERGSSPACHFVHPKIADRYAKNRKLDEVSKWINIREEIKEGNIENKNGEEKIENKVENKIEVKIKILQEEKEEDKEKENNKDLNDENKGILVLADQQVIARKSDGYINVTQLCKAGNKNYKHWNENIKSKEYLQALSLSVGIPTEELIIYESGSISNRSTWAHPQVAINIAQWISAEFSVKVSKWIYELAITGSVVLGKEKTNNELEELYLEKINFNKEINNLSNEYKTLKQENETMKKSIKNNNKERQLIQIETIRQYFNRYTNLINLDNQNVVYIVYIGEEDDKHNFKFGESSSIVTREKDHLNDFSKFELISVVNCNNSKSVENKFKQYIKGLNIKNIWKTSKNNHTEIFYLEENMDINIIIQKLEQLKNSEESITNVDNLKRDYYIEIMKKNYEIDVLKKHYDIELLKKDYDNKLLKKDNEILKKDIELLKKERELLKR